MTSPRNKICVAEIWPPLIFPKRGIFGPAGMPWGAIVGTHYCCGAKYIDDYPDKAVTGSMLLGTTLGVIAGYSRKTFSMVILRLADVIMSFPSLLLAVIVLYMLPPSILNLVIVLSITRIPIYLRTSRAEVLEIRERMFVQAAQVMGAGTSRIIFRHILPMVLPTILTIATLDFAVVMLAESSLSFLGIGIQAPEITWGLMVSQGRPYLTTAWWLSFWPGLAIILTTLSLNLVSNWLRIALDPQQRWRLEQGGRKNG